MSTKVERLVKKVNRELTQWTNTYSVKSAVGDSVDNNRVPSVRQAIRYLKTGVFTSVTGNDLEAVYTILRQKGFFKKLRRNNNRTDAFDINEFQAVVSRFVTKDVGLKSTLGRNILSIL